MITADDIQPAAQAPAATQTAAPAAPTDDSQAPTIPDDVLKIPAVNGLLQGKPAAIWTPAGTDVPDLKPVVQHKDELVQAGFGFYRSKDGKKVVLFNTQFVSPDQVKKADDAGKIDSIAEPWSQVSQSFNDALGQAQGSQGEQAPAADASAGAAPAAGAPPPAGVDKKIATARLRNLALGSPTDGPQPGAGRLQNGLAKQVI